ncbi:MAG: hypothetical protein HY566_02170 [Candidatus Kerfeldbacteria bacterium]|nr:hypothetical protein [Candidatus Kerfeldbacteria bacterium]
MASLRDRSVAFLATMTAALPDQRFPEVLRTLLDDRQHQQTPKALRPKNGRPAVNHRRSRWPNKFVRRHY